MGVVVWDCEDYIAEAEKQIGDIIVYKDVNFKEKLSQDLSEFSNISYLKILRINRESHKKELKYFAIDFKKATNFGNLYLLPKIHKRLFEVPGRSVISNCDFKQ